MAVTAGSVGEAWAVRWFDRGQAVGLRAGWSKNKAWDRSAQDKRAAQRLVDKSKGTGNWSPDCRREWHSRAGWGWVGKLARVDICKPWRVDRGLASG